LFSMLIGTIGHFLYNLLNQNKIIGFLFAQNESTWEHIKLGITPIILWSIIELIILKNPNTIINMSIKIIVFTLSIIILYYGYKKLLKKNILFLDILIFYISLGISSLVSIKLLNSDLGFLLNFCSFIGICFIIWLYNKFNKNTPNWFIFKNPN